MNLINSLKKKSVKHYLDFLKRNTKITNQILFCSFHGFQYSDNPRAISEKLHELYPEIKIVWFIQKGISLDLPEYIRVVCPRSKFTLVKEILKSFCYVTNYDLGRDIRKNDSQLFIQTWHGDIGLKKVLYEAWENELRPEPIYDEYYTDYCIAGSIQGETQFKQAFHFKGSILRYGCPRNDVLIKKDPMIERNIRLRYKIAEGKKILLYAPTFRDNNIGEKQVIDINLSKVISILNSRTKEDWVCLLRSHSLSRGFTNQNIDNNIIDVSNYQDMADLLSIADMLITDYSSCAGDFLITRKPTILALFDLDEYLVSCRGFQFDPHEAGFIIAHNQTELETIIQTITSQRAKQNCEELIKHFGIVDDGRASERVCKLIYKHYSMIKPKLKKLV